MKLHLFDIEGTITPITFVKDVLFPYSSNQMDAYIKNHPEEASKVLKFMETCEDSLKPARDIFGTVDVAEILKTWISQDLKVSILKELQGKIWIEGFESGAVVGKIFLDAVGFIKNNSECAFGIYSSGSIQAQKLLLKYNDQEDLTNLFTFHFDTTNAGPKKDSSSYENIKNAVGDEITEIIFYTDILEEALAARAVGIESVILLRPGNKKIGSEKLTLFKCVKTFDELK